MSLGSPGNTCRLIIDSYYLFLWNPDFSVKPALGIAQTQGSSLYTQINKHAISPALCIKKVSIKAFNTQLI